MKTYSSIKVPPEAGSVVAMLLFEGRLIVACQYRVYELDPETNDFMPIYFAVEEQQ